MRSILVTGSSSGIGATLSRRLAEPGVGLLVHARDNAEGAERTAAAVREAGAEAVVALGDLSQPETGARLVDAAVSNFGGLDTLIANAGLPILKSLAEGSREELDYALATAPRTAGSSRSAPSTPMSSARTSSAFRSPAHPRRGSRPWSGASPSRWRPTASR
jgi:NAD(P)-dependent dehydrogenase (short-subunit alcohol dehydrogenase family)